MPTPETNLLNHAMPLNRFASLLSRPAAAIPLATVVALWPVCGWAETGTFVDRWDAGDLRVLSYNVYRDAIFDGGTNRNKFDRIVDATQPDVIALQEVYDHSPSEVAALLNEVSPLPSQTSWNAWRWSDNVIASPYSFLLTTGNIGHADALIDLPDDTFDWDLFVLNDHLPCCDNEPGRQDQADRIIDWLEDARTPDQLIDRIDIPQNTPFLVLGDFNIVRSGRPLETLITGAKSTGETAPPDWDGTPITDSHPLQNGAGPDDYTWRDDSSVFDPGILDFILFSDSVLETANRFVLNTTTMSDDELEATGLLADDVVLWPASGTFDHLPLVVDFRYRPRTAAGDYDRNDAVNTDDYLAWLTQFGADAAPPADGNGNGYVDAADYAIWRDSLRGVALAVAVPTPEPSGVALAGVCLGLALGRSARRPGHRAAA